MRAFVLAVVVASTHSVLSASVLPYGHAAYTYGPMHCTDDVCSSGASCNSASYAGDIARYNQGTENEEGRIKHIMSYGGDFEFWPAKGSPHSCWAPSTAGCNASVFFDDVNRKAAAIYSEVDGVEGVTALFDGRMNGWQIIEQYNDYDYCRFGDFYPDLRNLTEGAMTALAEEVATKVCADDTIEAAQIDLEPFNSDYSAAVSSFVQKVSIALEDKSGSRGCRTARHPAGRALSYYSFAHSQSYEFTRNSLRHNGYHVFSLYDLHPSPIDGGFMYNTVEEFGDKMRYELSFIPEVVGTDGHFSLAIPISASCHEYERYEPMKGPGCGPACTPEVNIQTMEMYVEKAMDVLLSPEVTQAFGGLFCMNKTSNSQFLGISLWVWTEAMSYPSARWFDNTFSPPTPHENVLSVLHKNLHRFSTDACLDLDCSSDVNRPNGCECSTTDHCASGWCSQVCHDKPASWLDKAPVAWSRQYGDPHHHHTM